jgi:ATP adenylyltransferase/5',5'''-P-1,P-4-tetraphosphate phosphorylase II
MNIHKSRQLLEDDFEMSSETFIAISELTVQKRIVQNLQDINFDDDSDEDKKYRPSLEEEDEFETNKVKTHALLIDDGSYPIHFQSFSCKLCKKHASTQMNLLLK